MEKTRTERLLERSGRITPREVLEAYRETGLKPSRLVFAANGRACGIGAAAASVRGVALVEGNQDVIENFLFDRIGGASSEYRDGFSSGFDGAELYDGDLFPEETYGPLAEGCRWWYRAGWRDGRRSARFVFEGRG